MRGFLCTVFLLAASLQLSAQTRRIEGVVVDSAGRTVSRAQLTLRAENQILETETDASGAFVFEIAGGPSKASIETIADGFDPANTEVDLSSSRITITLAPHTVTAKVAILRTDMRLDETPASVVAIAARELATTAALTLDDKLRQVPGFSLFRRAGSRTANPTTQGVSLRGVGASGASRALVIADGVPLNDAFGGWIYWGRVPSEAVLQVEVLRGPAGDLYGSSAVGGVISIVTRRPTSRPVLTFEASYGDQETPAASVFTSGSLADWRASIAADLFRTDGFVPVAREQRGLVDTAANVRRSVIAPTVERILGDGRRVFVSAAFFQERRANGTPLQSNDTSLRSYTAGIDWRFESAGSIVIRAHGESQDYNQSFTAVAPDRNSESLTRLQHVPSQVIGASGQWNAAVGRALLFAGFDAREVRGRSDETGFAAQVPTSESSAGGRERTAGIFAGGVLSIGSRLQLSGSLRYDEWKNYRGSSSSRSLTSGATTMTEFPDRTETAVSPRISALYRVSDRVSVAGTFTTGFRRPTLNELYRNFRVGDVLTLANADLRAERAVGGDAAVLVNALEHRLFTRLGAFCTRVSRNVSNVTLSVTPTLITRQRQNVGRTRSCGVEADGHFQINDEVRISGGYLFVDPRVTSHPALEGLLIPQVARHQFTFQGEYSNPRTATIALQFRAAGSQFDDDQNLFRLAPFSTTDAFVSRRLTTNITLFGAVENIFNTSIESGRTPVLTLASPRTARIGIRFRFGD